MIGVRWYMEAVVRPSVADFEAHPHDTRRAIVAAMVLHHVADHLAAECGKSLTDRQLDALLSHVQKQVRQSVPDLALIGDVAIAAKHARITRGAKRQVTRVAQVRNREGLFRAPFGAGLFSEACPDSVCVTLDSGEVRELLPLIRTGLAQLEQHLDALGHSAAAWCAD